MDKIYITLKDAMFLDEWKETHKEDVRNVKIPFEYCRIIFFDEADKIISYLTVVYKNEVLKFTFNKNGKPLTRVDFERATGGMWRLLKYKSALPDENNDNLKEVYIQSQLTVVMSLFAFMINTNDVPLTENARGSSSVHKKHDNKKDGKGKPKTDDCIYIMKYHHNGGARFVVKGSHSSPNHEFGVRGHYRAYKSGKKIWIKPYTKGKGKHKDKKYRLTKGNAKND